MVSIASLDQLKQYMGISLDLQMEDENLYQMLKAISRSIEMETGRIVLPQRGELPHKVVATYPYEVNLRADLQILRAVRDAAGEIPLSALELLKEVGLLRRNDQAFFRFDAAAIYDVWVTGDWVWHENYAQAWPTVGNLAADVTPEANWLEVSNLLSPLEGQQLAPFQVGQMLAIDAEWFSLERIDSENQRLYLIRGIHGTVAESHVSGSPIAAYQAPDHLRMLSCRWAAKLYQASSNGNESKVLAELKKEIEGMQRHRFSL